ncbi:MAG: CcmD family protein [Cyclobacteriaceae bacterium]
MKRLLIIVLLFFSLNLMAGVQQNGVDNDLEGDVVEMADTMRSEGKIYVVVAILTTILAGLIIYLVMIDRKVNKLEKNLDQDKENQINI